MADRRWACSICEVSVSFAAGHDVPAHPSGWEQQVDGGWRCITCARTVAAEAALAAGEVASVAEGIARYLLLRDPGVGNRAVAAASRLPPHRIALMRRRLVEQGVIERRVPGPKPAAKPKPAATAKPKPRRAKQPTPLQQRIGAALKADAEQTDKAVAAELGCSHATVAARRKALERAGAIPKTKRQGFAATRRISPRVTAKGGSS